MKTKIYNLFLLKNLLNKKFAIVFASIVLCVTILKAQIPDQLKNLPPFKLRTTILSSLKESHLPGKMSALEWGNNTPCLKKQNTLGGTGNDFGNKLIPTRDGGFIVCGGTNSADGDFSVPVANGEDGFIAKYNKHRQLEWTKTAGGTGDDVFNDIAQTSDGGYIVAANTSSIDGDVTGNHGILDMWVVKFSPKGNIQWQKCLGGSGVELGEAVVETLSGDYAVAGFANSTDGDVSEIHGDFDAWLVRLSSKGNLLSQHCYGGTAFDDFIAIVRADAGNLILQGATQSNDGDVRGNHGGTDSWAVKINPFGKIIWETTFGDTTEDNSSQNIAKTTDGNVVIEGYSYVASGIVGPNDSLFSFQTKLNSHTGNIIWSKNYHEPAERGGSGVLATADGGTVETAHISNSIFDGTTYDVLVSKFDANGNQVWYKRLGGSDFDGGLNGGCEDRNGKLNILCQTASADGDVKNNHGGVDTWLIKLGSCGERDDDENSGSANQAISATQDKAAIDKPAITTIKLYPNPANDILRIEGLNISSKTILSLFNASGKLMQQSTATGETYTYNLQKLAAGHYYIKIESDKKVTTLKFVKQ